MGIELFSLISLGKERWVHDSLESAFMEESVQINQFSAGKKMEKINLLCTYLNSWLKSLLCLNAGLQQ